MLNRITARAHIAALLALVLLLAAPTRRVEAQTLEPVTVRLSWAAGAIDAPLFLAAARGYFKEEGIDIDIRDGKGSNSTIQAVAAGTDTIGLANLALMAQAVGRGIPLVGIAGMMQKAPDSIVSLKGSGIATPKDLEGKRWAFVPTDSSARIFPAFAAANGINMDTLKKIQVSYATNFTSLLQGDADFICAWASPDAFKIAKQKPIEKPMRYADYGVSMLGTGIFVTKDTAAKRADLLKRFLRATVRGAEAAAKEPEAAVGAVMAARPDTDRAILVEEYNNLPEYLHTKYSTGHTPGWVASEDWDQTLTLLKQYFEAAPDLKAAAVYTNEFLPGQ
jgi:NitT/TauT family transport system substrate-binding protein